MKIIDINKTERDVESLKRITQKVPDKINEGEFVDEDYVEVVIIGKYRDNWKEWYPVNDFKKLNPNVTV